MLLNLYGDFIKGSVNKIKNEKLKKAVILHRQIDDFIDNHKKVLKLKLEIYKELPKVAGIAIDLYFDHLLAKKWNDYHKQSLKDYLDVFFNQAPHLIYEFEEKKQIIFHPFFKQLINRIHKENWILNYKNIEGLLFACSGLSKRISFENNLNEGHIVFLKHQDEIQKTFEEFMINATKKFFK